MRDGLVMAVKGLMALGWWMGASKAATRPEAEVTKAAQSRGAGKSSSISMADDSSAGF